MYFQVLHTFLHCIPQIYNVLNVIRLFIISHCLLARKVSRFRCFIKKYLNKSDISKHIFDQSNQVMKATSPPQLWITRLITIRIIKTGMNRKINKFTFTYPHIMQTSAILLLWFLPQRRLNATTFSSFNLLTPFWE